jgi:hypothetical protein
MRKLWFAVAIAILVTPLTPALRAQDGGFGGGFGGGDSVDVTGILGDRGGRGGNGGNGGRGGLQLPDSRLVFSQIQSALKKGKTPLQKSQEKPLQSMLDQEITNLSDRIQVLRSENNNRNENNNNGGGNFPGGNNFPRGGNNFPGGAAGDNNNANATANALNVQIETLTALKNDDFLDNKIAAFLSPEQVALVKKAKAEDKANTSCLGGLLDRASNPLQNAGGGGRGNRGGGNFNFNLNNSTTKSNGQAYCMTAESTPSERLEPIRKVLAGGNLPLAKDKEPIAEAFMNAQIKDLGDSLRTSLTASFAGNRGGNGGGFNRNNNPQQVIQSSTDNMYKKAEAMLEPAQVESLKKWHFDDIFSRDAVDSLIAVEAMQDTPLGDDQIARLTAAYPELRNQIQAAAKAAKQNLSAKDLDNASMAKLVDMLDAPQAASYQAAKKLAAAYGK